MKTQWVWRTTFPSGKSHTHGADDGQTGWRLHLVDTASLRTATTFIKGDPHLVEVSLGPALCGVNPRKGWGLDMFINKPCQRCLKAAEKRGLELPAIQEC